MAPSMTLIKLNALVSVIKAVFDHITSRKWRDWDLVTHIQFEILRRLDASMLTWTIEDVPLSRVQGLSFRSRGLQ
jgi:hypothetical protein